MRLGLIGRGNFGQVYASTLRKLEIEFWHKGRDVDLTEDADGIIIASANETHYPLAEFYIANDIPVLIEKPVTLSSMDARSLLNAAVVHDAIVFAGHTRLYSNAWREFREPLIQQKVESVYACAGCTPRGDTSAIMDWGPHMVAMCIDIGFDPRKAHLVCLDKPEKMTFIVNGKHRFVDVDEHPTPVEVLLTEFMEAIDYGAPDYRALQMNVQIMDALEAKQTRIAKSMSFPRLGEQWH